MENINSMIYMYSLNQRAKNLLIEMCSLEKIMRNAIESTGNSVDDEILNMFSKIGGHMQCTSEEIKMYAEVSKLYLHVSQGRATEQQLESAKITLLDACTKNVDDTMKLLHYINTLMDDNDIEGANEATLTFLNGIYEYIEHVSNLNIAISSL